MSVECYAVQWFIDIKQFNSYVKASQDEHIKLISDHWKNESNKLK